MKWAMIIRMGGHLRLLLACLMLTMANSMVASSASAVGEAIRGGNGAYFSSNTSQGFGLAFGPHGFAIKGGNNLEWTLGLDLQGIGRESLGLRPAEAPSWKLDGHHLEVDHGPFEMHYTNLAAGMRHDLVIHERPRGEGALEARFHITGNLVAFQTGPGHIVFHAFDVNEATMVPVLDYKELLAWDAAGVVLASRMLLRDDHLILEVEDRNALYPITIDPLSSTANTVIPALGVAGDDFGFRVATAGDVNGDGISDVLIGAPGKDGRKGQVWLHYGTPSGLSATAAWTLAGSAANDEFGFSVSTAGDVNGDGFSDVVIGAPGEAGCGAIWVFLGSATGLTGGAVRYGDSQVGSAFGHSVALAGDVNGDGFSDVVVGAPLYDKLFGGTDNGKIYVYHGSTGGVAFFASWTAEGANAGGRLGFSVSGAGDLNGDGFSDVAAGAPFDKLTSPPQTRGRVYLFQGAAAGLPATATTILSGPANNAEFGSSVAGAGDTNGDGLADLVVGSPGATNGNGRVDLYQGTSSGTLVVTTSTTNFGGTGGERLGASVAPAGDVNGDGYADVVVAGPLYSTGKGRVRVAYGSSAGLNLGGTAAWNKTGSANGDGLGTGVYTAGDVNGDGISDLVVGIPGKAGGGEVAVYHGAIDFPGTVPEWSQLGGAAYATLGRCVAQAGDVNGDGFSDVLVGIPGYNDRQGMVELYLGSASGLSATPVWTKYGEGSLDTFGQSVASLGDVNGDGYSDVIIGAPSYPNYGWRGKVYVYHGGPGGLAATPAWTYVGEKLEDRLGWSVASAGDVNGDGYSDAIIGAYMFNMGGGASDVGKAYAFHGSATGLGAAPAWTDIGTEASFYGNSVSTAGDVNGDGYDDVIVGAPFWDIIDGSGDVVHNIGSAFVYHGSATGLSPVANWSCLGERHGDEFGYSVSFAGDVNGDGFSDVIIGGLRADNPPESQTGRAYVFHGQPLVGLGPTAATVISGTLPNDQLGFSVCSAGDVNGDGFSDVVVGVPLYDMLYVNQGAAQIHLGSSAGIASSYSLLILGPAVTNAQMGNSVALAGDVNGDGISDLIIGADQYSPSFSSQGGAYLYMGRPGVSMPTFQYRSDLTTQVRTSNGTFEAGCNWGIGQFARTSLGRNKVKLAWQVAGHGPGTVLGSPYFDHVPVETGESAVWTDSGLNGVLIKEAMTGPTGTGHPMWRVRVKHHLTTAIDGRPYGRWFMQGIHDLQVPSLKTELVECGPLPVRLLENTVKCIGGDVVIEWATASEKNCDRFVVMRSDDGHSWAAITVVAGSGNTAHEVRYQAIDPDPFRGRIAYYRLDQYDEDGSRASFPVMVLMPCQGDRAIQAWPNPATDAVFISVATRTDDEAPSIDLFDAYGRKVLHTSAGRAGHGVFEVKGLSGLPTGVYLVEVSSAAHGVIGQTRIVKQ